MAMIYCVRCGKRISENVQVCPYCGAKNLAYVSQQSPVKTDQAAPAKKSNKGLLILSLILLLAAIAGGVFLFFTIKNDDGSSDAPARNTPAAVSNGSDLSDDDTSEGGKYEGLLAKRSNYVSGEDDQKPFAEENYSYSKNGYLVRTEGSGTDDRYNFTAVFDYSGDTKIRMTKQYETGDLSGLTVIQEYNSDGSYVEHKVYTNYRIAGSSAEPFTADIHRHYSSDGKLTLEEVCSHENGELITSTEIIRDQDHPDTFTAYVYNADDELINTRYGYDIPYIGITETWSDELQYEFNDNGDLTKAYTTGGNSSEVPLYAEYEYDDEGRVTLLSLYKNEVFRESYEFVYY